MTDLTDIFTEVSLQDALWLARTRNYDRGENRDMMLVAIFSDGLEIAWTPTSPPRVYVRRVKK